MCIAQWLWTLSQSHSESLSWQPLSPCSCTTETHYSVGPPGSTKKTHQFKSWKNIYMHIKGYNVWVTRKSDSFDTFSLKTELPGESGRRCCTSSFCSAWSWRPAFPKKNKKNVFFLQSLVRSFVLVILQMLRINQIMKRLEHQRTSPGGHKTPRWTQSPGAAEGRSCWATLPPAPYWDNGTFVSLGFWMQCT